MDDLSVRWRLEFGSFICGISWELNEVKFTYLLKKSSDSIKCNSYWKFIAPLWPGQRAPSNVPLPHARLQASVQTLCSLLWSKKDIISAFLEFLFLIYGASWVYSWVSVLKYFCTTCNQCERVSWLVNLAVVCLQRKTHDFNVFSTCYLMTWEDEPS